MWSQNMSASAEQSITQIVTATFYHGKHRPDPRPRHTDTTEHSPAALDLDCWSSCQTIKNEKHKQHNQERKIEKEAARRPTENWKNIWRCEFSHMRFYTVKFRYEMYSNTAWLSGHNHLAKNDETWVRTQHSSRPHCIFCLFVFLVYLIKRAH